MFGMLVIVVAAIYVAISIGLIIFVSKWAKRSGRSSIRWGAASALVMYLLVFWDHVPTLLLRNHYCSEGTGFEIRKTLEQWQQENPGAVDTLRSGELLPSLSEKDKSTYFLNNRFEWVIQKTSLPLYMRLKEEKIVDRQTGQVLATFKDVSTQIGSIGVGGSLRDFKFWLDFPSCEAKIPLPVDVDPPVTNETRMAKFVKATKNLGAK